KRRYVPGAPEPRRLSWLAVALPVVALLALGTMAWLNARHEPAAADSTSTAASSSSKQTNDPASCGCGMAVDETAVVPDAGPVEETEVRKEAPPGGAPAGMVWVPGGQFSMGSPLVAFGDARPIHTVELDGFWMDRTPVTNEQFAAFVKATGYVTIAE